MDMSSNESRNETLEALRRERARQDEELAEAASRLRARGQAVVTVPRTALEAIDQACLVPVFTLNPTAIRG